MKKMFITADDPRSDYRYVTAIAESEEDGLELYDYVVIKYKENQWIGQITSPNINIPVTGRQFDPAILHAIKLFQQNADIQLAENIEKWEILLLGEYDGRSLSTLRRRPKPGSSVEKLNRETTINVLNLPGLKEYPDKSTSAIGYLLNAEDVPLCVDHTIFTHHILVSGGTGSGKSNTCANLVSQASKQGFTVFLYDAKPDYQMIAKANTDIKVAKIWHAFDRYGIQPGEAENLTKVAIYGVGKARLTGDYRGYDKVIGFKASDFEPYFFASLFFDANAKANSYEEFASVCANLRSSKKSFSLDEAIVEVKNRKETYENAQNPQNRIRFDAPKIHPQTADTIIRDIRRNRDKMVWLDSVGKKIKTASTVKENVFATSSFGDRVESFDAKYFINRGGIIHIDCSNLDPQNYALFLSRFIHECQRYQIDQKGRDAIIQFVDEAHRIFDNNSRYSDLLARDFNRVMREGRSLKHGVITSLQNASQVPSIVMNNFNSHIVMKQNNREVARAATQIMDKSFVDQSMTLAPGHALCRMFESSATVLAQMAPSPFELMRPDNSNE